MCTFLTSETITIVVVRLSNTADMKKVITPTTHMSPLFLFEVITSVTTLKPKGTDWDRQMTIGSERQEKMRAGGQTNKRRDREMTEEERMWTDKMSAG